MTTPENIYGRKWGRGIRPWLLIPKYLCVSLIIGGLLAISILTIGAQFATSAEQSRFVWKLVAAIFHFQIIPATVATVLLGILLLLQHPLVFLRMRWLLVKLGAIVVVVPGAHSYLSWRMGALSRDPSAGFLLPGAILALFGFICIAVLGRLKPRLGQGYAAIENPQLKFENV